MKLLPTTVAALAALAACGPARETCPQPATPKVTTTGSTGAPGAPGSTTMTSRFERVVIPELVVPLARKSNVPQIAYIAEGWALDEVEVAPDATLSTVPGVAAELATIVRRRATAIREAKDTLKLANDEIGALERQSPHDDPPLRDAKQRIRARLREVNAPRWGIVDKANEALVAKLAQYRATLTEHGMWMRALRLVDRADSLVEQQLEAAEQQLEAPAPASPRKPRPPPPVTAIRPDYRDVGVAIGALLARFPRTIYATRAKYVRAMIEAPADANVAAGLLLEVADEAHGTELAERSDLHAALLYAHDADELDRARVILRQLGANAKSASRRHVALLVEAELSERQHDSLHARMARCRALDDGYADRGNDVARAIAEQLADAGDLDPVRAACVAKRCPCVEPVLAALATRYRPDDDDDMAKLAQVVQVWAAAFPKSTRIPAASPRSAGGPPTEQVKRFVTTSHAIDRCDVGRWTGGKVALAVLVGAQATVVDALPETQTTPQLTACVAAAFRRHRWVGLDGTLLEVHLKLELR